MSVDRIKFQNIVESQLPDYVRDDFPLLGEFLRQYYVSQEFESGTYDLIQNIDQYIKIEELTKLTTSTVLGADLSYTGTTITTDLTGNFTEGFPINNGLLMIDDEIIFYEYKTEFTFENCRRGFSGTTSYQGSNTPDELVFTTTEANVHQTGATIKNLNVLFLQLFLTKVKAQVIPGFDERTLFPGLDQENFILSSDSFYKSKGTSQAFEILFRALYGVDVEVIRPSEFLLTPSNANFKVTTDIVIERFLGDPLELINKTLYQDSSGARGSVSNVRPVVYNDKKFYQISLDLGYQRDINLNGTVLGSFQPVSKTQVLNDVSIGSTIIDVDSTVGFPQSGSLVTTTIDDENYGTTFSTKNDNQLFNVPPTTELIKKGTEINIADLAYAYVNGSVSNEKIQVKILSALKDISFDDKNYSLKKDDVIEFQSIGIEKNIEKTRNWSLNVKASYLVESVTLLDVSSKSYRFTVDNPTILDLGSKIDVINTDNIPIRATVSSVQSSTVFTANTEGLLDPTNAYSIENQILYTNSTKYPYLKKYFTNVQNTYSKINNDVLVASNSIPSFRNILINPYDRSLNFTGTATDNTLELVTTGDHGFYTGDAIYYTPSVIVTTTIDTDGNKIITETPSTFEGVLEGVYYVKRVTNLRIKLSKSRSNLFNDLYITLNGNVENVNFTYYNFYQKTFEPQPIYRSILPPVNKTGEYKTVTGHLGILNNGVEVLNYKSPNRLNYGRVREFDVVNRGKAYDVINPPIVRVSDEVGIGATGIANVKGHLERIEILDTGFDYQERPIVSISGGNGLNASAEVRLSAVTHSVAFNAEQNSAQVSLGASTIGFSTYHKFRDGEEVIYQTFGQMAVGGLSTAASYHVGVIDSKTVKLYETFNDSIVGINTIRLSFFGNGVQNLKSSELKNVVTSIVVTNSGVGYENKEQTIVGVNTALDRINIEGHGYQSKEIVRYTGTTIEGLAQSKDYYVVRVDDNSFSLTEVGTGVTTPKYYYDRNILVDLNSIGTGSFNYKPIVVTVDGVTGVSTRTGQNFNCQVQPVFRGEVQSIDTTNGGVGYGSSEIINFDRKPVVTLFSGSGAVLTPVINNGQIVDILVNDKGQGYNSPPDLEIITTTGKNASLTPVLNNGKIESVTIIKGGAGYVANETSIYVTPSGREAVIETMIDQWNINLFERNFNNIQNDDGFLDNSTGDTELEYSYLYVPRPLRENTFAISGTSEDNARYGTPDLVIKNGVEQTSVYHSPLIGWAYDGNPIYGPYGFDQASGSSFVKAMKPGYELTENLDGRPPVGLYPLGFFIEDYIFTGEGDLDEHNGRFCVTPDYPNGIYAYFATINTINDSVGPFAGFRRPQFPYLIGNSFHSVPEPFNFKVSSNQNNYDIQSGNWLRNTYSYNLCDVPSGYKYIFNPNSVKDQQIEITSASLGKVESVGIITGGSEYKINDLVRFDNKNSGGIGAQAHVSSLDGKSIDTVSIASTVFYDIEFTPFRTGTFLGFSTQFHEFNTTDIVNVSGLSSYFGGFDGSYRVGVRTDNFVLTLGVSSAPSNQVEYLYVSGILEYPFIRPNDILTINQEQVKVLNLDGKSGRIRAQRAVNGTTGTAHTSSEILFENPKKFSINVGALKTTRVFNLNQVLYFDPAESLGLGTALGTGLGTTITFSNPGVGVTQVIVPPQNIYYPNHGLKLNDSVSYSTNGGTSVQVWNGTTAGYVNLSSYQNLFAVPLSVNTLGISSNKVGLGSTGYYVGVNTSTALLYFTGVGVGNTHNFTTNLRNVVTAEVSKNTVTVSTASSHGLTKGDLVNVTVKPTLEKTIIVKYDNHNRRMVFDPKSFTAGNVDLVKNSITFSGEFFKRGDKVIYTSSSPSGGLENEGMYYTVPFNDVKVRLVKERWEVTQENPNFVDITSASSGTLSKINPTVNVQKNNTLTFDLSDSSLAFISGGTAYPAFDMNLYTDRGYSNTFFTTGLTNSFEVVKTGRPGVDSDASLVLSVRDSVPSQLYYKFDTDVLDLIPRVKSEIVIDEEVYSYNGIEIIQSTYNGNYSIVGVGTTSFEYTIPDVPQVPLYNSTNSVLKYTTTSLGAYGPISKITVSDGGAGYKQLPGITSIRSGIGSNAIINLASKSIGQILATRFEDIGFNYPSDQTLKVVVNVPEVLEVEALQSFDHIGVTSSGKNYLNNPRLVVIDGFTGEQVKDCDIRFNLRDTEVDIFKNTNGLYDTTPTILPTNNSNGVGISSIVYTPSNQNVRAYLTAQFSEAGNFRYKTGAQVMIEGISVGIGSTARGYNSEDYNYALFEVTSYDMQLGGAGAYFEYSLEGYLKSGQIPGTMDTVGSVGRAIPQTDFPVFDITLKPNNFFIDEKVVSGTNVGIVERWNPTNRRLTISSSDEFEIGSRITGKSSGTEVIVQDRSNFHATVSTGAGTTFVDGWKTNSGFLNDSLQRIPNNEYYQKLSYSLKSSIPYDTWNDPVSSLSHVAGLAKFADLSVESEEQTPGGLFITTPSSDVEVVIDVISEASIWCWHDFDNVGENSFVVDGTLTSDEIIFKNKVLTDYNESFGNRVLSIDDFSGTFNSNERADKTATVGEFGSNLTYNKILTFARDEVLTNNRQVDLVSVLHNESTAYISQYGTLDTKNLGSYDFLPNSDGTKWFLKFSPIDFTFNSYNISSLSFSLLDNLSSVGATTFGTLVEVDSANVNVASNTTTTITSIPTTFRSAKLLVQIEDNTDNYSVDELNIVHDGTNVYLLEYGDIATNTTGFGTFNAYVSGSNINVDLIPSVGAGLTVNTSIIATSAAATGIGTIHLDTSKLDSTYTTIPSSGSPSANTIYTYTGPQEAAYHVITVTDTTNTEYESFEVITLEASVGPSEFVEYANVQSGGSLGQVGVDTSSGTLKLTYTPNASIATQVRVFSVGMEPNTDSGRPNLINLNNLQIISSQGEYTGTLLDRTTAFGLKHNGEEIFQRGFNGSDPSIVSVADNSVAIPDHFFVTGEQVVYSSPGAGTTAAIGIGTTAIPGIGVTDKLPSNLFVYAPNSKELKFSTTAANALNLDPVVISIASTGVGAGHSITSTKQNQKVLLAIDNIIQSPIVSFGITTTLAQNVVFQQDFLLAGVSSIFTGDNLRIGGEGGEIVTVSSVGVGNVNNVNVIRARMGTARTSHTAGDLVEKLSGEYNIVGNTLTFASAPIGLEPVAVGATIDPDGTDWSGISTSSTFQGRSFMRSGVLNSSNETYYQNYIYDNISYQFTGIRSEFSMKVGGSDVTGIATMNPFVIINGIAQEPTGSQPPSLQVGDFRMAENSGVTSITFTGNDGLPTGWDPNNGAYPIGGLMISVGSSEGSGYQPLVSAGGTATVSATGTISAISIGNSGSGYRVGIQTVVNVGVQTYSAGIPNIEFIGTAAISGGHIVSIAITNPGTGYTGTNPPDVVFDAPLSYSDIPLEYAPGYVGSGQSATANIIVGSGGSVVNFNIQDYGFGYGNGEILTIPAGGASGIPTNSSLPFKNFQLQIDEVFFDRFNSWSVGEIEVLDTLDNEFNGRQTNFQITLNEEPFTIATRTGSPIEVDQTLIVFINDVLQVPGSAYVFNGGSIIRFTEPPKVGDTSKILFYKGTSGVDVRFVDILETVKPGDLLDIDNNPELGQGISLEEEPRTVTGIGTVDTTFTNPYQGPGITTDPNLLRPVTWCMQLVDKIINGEVVGKDRPAYEPLIYPTSYLIQSVGLADTIGYINTVEPLFNAENETNPRSFQNRVTITSQDSLVGTSATAVVSTAGTVTSISITNAGIGYTLVPDVSISTPVGVGTTQRASATATISGGAVNGITVVNPGTGYTTSTPPIVLVETPNSSIETIPVNSYVGDYGVIVGFNTTKVGSQNKYIFDLFIPQDSFMRNGSLVGTGITVSQLIVGDYLTIFDTDISAGGSFETQNTSGNVVGTATSYSDGVYQVAAVSTQMITVAGYGVTAVRRITTNVGSIGNVSYGSTGTGQYSWGKVFFNTRVGLETFTAYTMNGYSGISTSGLLSRTVPLKSDNYV